MAQGLYLMRSKIICMKTIKIKTDVKERLEVFADGESINKAMRRLLESVELVDNVDGVSDASDINIHIDDDLLELLKRCKIVASESHSDTISRLLSEVEF